MFDLFDFFKRVTSFEEQKDICPASTPCGKQSADSFGTPLFTEQRWITRSPAMPHIPSMISVFRGVQYSWAQSCFYPVPAVGMTNVVQVHGSENPTLNSNPTPNSLITSIPANVYPDFS